MRRFWCFSDGPGQASSVGLSRSSSTASNLSREGEDSRDSGDVGDDKKDKEAKKDGSDEKMQQKPTFVARASDTADSIRLKCRDMLAKALEIPRRCSQLEFLLLFILYFWEGNL